MVESEEVPWFNEPPDAALFWSTEDLGHLHFMDPLGKKAVVPVTKGPVNRSPDRIIWHIEIKDDIATVTPSVHFVGQWHTPNPVQFKLIELIG